MNIEYYLEVFLTSYLVPVLDILIMSFLLFYIYLFIEKTKASNLAKGLVLVIFAFLIFELFSFPIFSWVFAKILSSILLIVIVLFSPEIRSLLIALGKRQSLKKLSKEELENLTKIVNAVDRLSIKQIGALIVILRKSEIRNLLTNFIPMDAQITEELFFFIFDKKSLVHDGAAVLQGNRMLYVSAILPLSDQDLPEKYMGTRHRAGMGITEESDAITIIVSEETGRISVCENGIMHHNLTPAVLKNLLKNLIYIEEDSFEIKDNKIDETDKQSSE